MRDAGACQRFPILVKACFMRFPDYFKPLPADEKRRLAKRLNVTLGYLYRLAGEFSSPSMSLAKDIQRETKGAVPVQDWTEEARA